MLGNGLPPLILPSLHPVVNTGVLLLTEFICAHIEMVSTFSSSVLKSAFTSLWRVLVVLVILTAERQCLLWKGVAVVLVQPLSQVLTFANLWTAACQASLSLAIYRRWPKFMSIESVCYLAISSSVIPLSSCLQYFSASGSFPVSWVFTSGG